MDVIGRQPITISAIFQDFSNLVGMNPENNNEEWSLTQRRQDAKRVMSFGVKVPILIN
jgi:hypothetical protein